MFATSMAFFISDSGFACDQTSANKQDHSQDEYISEIPALGKEVISAAQVQPIGHFNQSVSVTGLHTLSSCCQFYQQRLTTYF